MYRKTLNAHNNVLLFFNAIKEVTLCYNKVSDVVSCMTEYCFFCGRHNPCERRKTKEGDATDYYPDSASDAMRSISSTSGKKIKYSISVVRQICQSHRAEINKHVSQTMWIPDIDWVLHLGLEWQVQRQRRLWLIKAAGKVSGAG